MDEPKVTPRQQKAISALLNSGDIEQAASAAGVKASTIQKWLAQDDFILALNWAEMLAMNSVNRGLLSLSQLATLATRLILVDPRTTPQLRLKAVDSILTHLLRIRELAELEQRVAALERLQNESST